MAYLQKIKRLTPGRRRTLLKVTAMILFLRAALRLLTFDRVRALLARADHPGRPLSLDADEVKDILWAALTAGRALLGDAPCLPQALVVHFLLRRRGLPVTLHLGVRREGTAGVEAHAWVRDGKTILIGGGEEDLAAYREFPPLPHPTP